MIAGELIVRLWVGGELLGEQPIDPGAPGVAGVAAGLVLTGAADRATLADNAGEAWMIEIEQLVDHARVYVRFGTDTVSLALREVEVGASGSTVPDGDLLAAFAPASPTRGADGESFRCPVCQMVSHHPLDVLHGWCGNCHAFTGARS